MVSRRVASRVLSLWSRRRPRAPGRRWFAAAAALIGALAAQTAIAAAAVSLHRVSGRPYTSPLVCRSRGVDGEVSLARDPRSGHMVAAWMQDVEGFGDAGGLPLDTDVVVTAFSADGVQWTPSAAPPGVSLCDQAPAGVGDIVFDPSVSVGPDGRWYLGRLPQDAVPGAPVSASGVYVSSSTDGINWTPVATRVPTTGSVDLDSVVADPTVPGRAYVTADDFPLAFDPTKGPQHNRVVISQTTDGGAVFAPARAVHKSPTGFLDVESRLAVLTDGSLLDVFAEIPANASPAQAPFVLYATRSGDQGVTWSAPIRVGSGSLKDVVDPSSAAVYEHPCCLISIAAGPNNSVEVAWVTNPTTTSGVVHVASSADGGRSWPVIARLDRPAQAFEPTVAARHGEIAVSWYDFSGTQSAGRPPPTTVWFARSEDGGRTWTIDPLAGPFDVSAAKLVEAGNLGDFESLVPTARGFEAAFTLGKPYAQTGASDIFATHIP